MKTPTQPPPSSPASGSTSFRLLKALAALLFLAATPFVVLRVWAQSPDADGDGMPDAWESDHGLDPLNDADRIEPDDGDGVANFDEYLADTDPQDSNDFFRLTDCAYNPVRPDRGIFVGFTSSSNRLYSLQAADVPADDSEWRAMPGKTNYLGVGSYDGFNDTNAPFDATARVYRVVVAPIPE